MIFISETHVGDRVEYRDTKRYLWVLSFVPALLPLVFYSAYFATNQSPLWALGPLIFAYVFIPAMDILMGEDTHNPPEAVVNQLAEDSYYTRLLYVAVGVYFAAFAMSVWFFATADLPIWAMVMVAISAGVVSGTALTVGHELGHKPGWGQQLGAKLINGLSWYGHFTQEHTPAITRMWRRQRTAPHPGSTKATMPSSAARFPKACGAAGLLSAKSWNAAACRSGTGATRCCKVTRFPPCWRRR